MLIRTTLQYEYTNSGSAAIPGGAPVAVGTHGFGVAECEIAPGAVGVLAAAGVWSLPVANTLTAAAGDPAFWDATNSVVVKSGAGLLCIGVFAAAVAAGATDAPVAVFPTATLSASA